MGQYKYFEFNWIETEDGKISDQGRAYYFTSNVQNIDEMKNVVRNTMSKPFGVITIMYNIFELDRESYLQRGGYAPPD